MRRLEKQTGHGRKGESYSKGRAGPRRKFTHPGGKAAEGKKRGRGARIGSLKFARGLRRVTYSKKERKKADGARTQEMPACPPGPKYIAPARKDKKGGGERSAKRRGKTSKSQDLDDCLEERI